jgi:hypothetical protein
VRGLEEEGQQGERAPAPAPRENLGVTNQPGKRGAAPLPADATKPKLRTRNGKPVASVQTGTKNGKPVRVFFYTDGTHEVVQ